MFLKKIAMIFANSLVFFLKSYFSLNKDASIVKVYHIFRWFSYFLEKHYVMLYIFIIYGDN